MTFDQVLSALKNLSRSEQLRLIADVARLLSYEAIIAEGGVEEAIIPPGEYEVWLPIEAPEAAYQMQQMLAEHKKEQSEE